MSKILEIAESIVRKHNEITNNVYGEGALVNVAEYDGDSVETIIPLDFYEKDVANLPDEEISFLFISAIQEDLLRLRREKLVFGSIGLDTTGVVLITGGDDPENNLHFDCLVRYHVRRYKSAE